MRIAFAGLPAHGHLYPMVPLALACARAGHDVAVGTGAPFVGALPVPTFEMLPPEADLSWAENETMRRHPGISGMEFGLTMFAEVTAEVVATSLLPAFERDRPDLVVYEGTCIGAGIAASVLGIPALTFATGQWHPFAPPLHAQAVESHGWSWTDRGQEAPTGVLLAGGVVDPLPPSWTSPEGPGPLPRIPLRTQAWSNADAEIPAWLRIPGDRPRAYVTLGTVSFGAVDVLRRAVVETAATGVDVLVAIGPRGEPDLLGPLPDSVHLERFVAQDKILPLVDVIVHHGGSGTVLGALEAGIPQVIAPQGADQFFNGQRLIAIGAGRVVPNEAPEGSVADAVRGVLDGTAERAVAMSVAAEIASMPAPAEVVRELVAFARAELVGDVTAHPGG